MFQNIGLFFSSLWTSSALGTMRVVSGGDWHGQELVQSNKIVASALMQVVDHGKIVRPEPGNFNKDFEVDRDGLIKFSVFQKDGKFDGFTARRDLDPTDGIDNLNLAYDARLKALVGVENGEKIIVPVTISKDGKTLSGTFDPDQVAHLIDNDGNPYNGHQAWDGTGNFSDGINLEKQGLMSTINVEFTDIA